MEMRELGLGGVLEIRPDRHGDSRGFFSETYNRSRLENSGIRLEFVQDNFSYSRHKGVLRGLHYQLPPAAQDKLVRVSRGSILDVAVDIRRNSPSFGASVSLVVSADAWNQIFIPKGFAHGFLTLEDDTEVVYKVTDYYSPQHDRAIRFDDPDINIEWPVARADIVMSDKDRAAPLLADAETF
ncbi:dTDP-4-dehydrorhamnose 3,5-epimerase [Nitratireductor sp. XY-223]|uniref:dTDP-4-dehydrorhamnose 3,5-epimerase n=1 Tax=Nitratireductor sp. XY-223 TaxID=2561926 RepID=UPI0010A9D04D|nr:dTDP-4-dehydrorhamnose 3,5-epimerase [Nitratireductor sp. XY-223]